MYKIKFHKMLLSLICLIFIFECKSMENEINDDQNDVDDQLISFKTLCALDSLKALCLYQVCDKSGQEIQKLSQDLIERIEIFKKLRPLFNTRKLNLMNLIGFRNLSAFESEIPSAAYNNREKQIIIAAAAGNNPQELEMKFLVSYEELPLLYIKAYFLHDIEIMPLILLYLNKDIKIRKKINYDITKYLYSGWSGLDAVPILGIRSENGSTIMEISLLMFAICTNDVKLLEKLLLNGTKFDKSDLDPNSFLEIAIVYNQFYDNFDLIQMLLKHGALVNAKNEKGQTPIMLAVSFTRDKKIIQALLVAGADLSITDNNGENVQSYCNEVTAAYLRNIGAKCMPY